MFLKYLSEITLSLILVVASIIKPLSHINSSKRFAMQYMNTMGLIQETRAE